MTVIIRIEGLRNIDIMLLMSWTYYNYNCSDAYHYHNYYNDLVVDATGTIHTNPVSPKSPHPVVASFCWYYGQVFSEKIMKKTWNAKFMVSKRLNTLKTVRILYNILYKI